MNTINLRISYQRKLLRSFSLFSEKINPLNGCVVLGPHLDPPSLVIHFILFALLQLYLADTLDARDCHGEAGELENK